jgi:phosphomannomutase
VNIHFGTDGWRGVIARDFTFDNLTMVARAFAAHLHTVRPDPSRVMVGYDTRFLSGRFAWTVAEVLAQAGHRVTVSDSFVSTPALSSAVVSHRAHTGVMISASHNPPEFNGFKIKTSLGASAPETETAEIERLLGASDAGRHRTTSVRTDDFVPAYLDRIASTVDLPLIRSSRLSVVVDPMHGAGTGYVDRLLRGGKCSVVTIHERPDTMFGGLHPEPIEKYLEDLKKSVIHHKAYAGLATDGDADRIGVVDDTGRYLTPHQVFPLLLYYLCHYRKRRGKVVQALSLGYLSKRIADDYGLPFAETSIGFKNIADYIVRENILIGGEESGGYGYGNYLPERDGVLNSLLLCEMIASTGKPLSRLLKEVEDRYGTSCYLRTDFPNPGIAKKDFVQLLRKKIPSKIAGKRVIEVKDYDGVEFLLEDDSWLLLRPSGTEPIIRVYSEAPDILRTRRIISWGNNFIKKLR